MRRRGSCSLFIKKQQSCSLILRTNGYRSREIVFQELPDNFFVPLASRYRIHYSELLLVYYGLFMEYHTGIEREEVVSAFQSYFEALPSLSELAESEGDWAGEDGHGTIDEDTVSVTTVANGSNNGSDRPPGSQDSAILEPAALATPASPRELSVRFLRRLLQHGWMNEEELADFTRVINISSYAKPFFEALHRVSHGIKVEYESHVIAVYSSLCTDAVKDNGHLAVMNAHEHTRLLIESLKVLEQNIKTHIQRMYERNTEVRDILHIHYDVYMNEVVDKAYTRLKTSENLSKYRPKINAAVRRLVEDEKWMARTAEKLSQIRHYPVEESRRLLADMLKEIRSDLRSIDPILEEIDDKNRRYSRISTERIKAKLYADSSLQGKIGDMLKAFTSGDPAAPSPEELGTGLYSSGFLSAGSLYNRRPASVEVTGIKKPETNDFDREQAEAELHLRIHNQLGPDKIARFLSRYVPQDGRPVPAERIVTDMRSYVRLLYAAAYGETRSENFPYRVTWEDEQVTVGRFKFRRHHFIKEPGFE